MRQISIKTQNRLSKIIVQQAVKKRTWREDQEHKNRIKKDQLRDKIKNNLHDIEEENNHSHSSFCASDNEDSLKTDEDMRD